MNTEVVVIGNIVRENIIFTDKIIGPVLGSPCAYSSIIMAKLGVPVGIVSYIDSAFDPSLFNQFAAVDQNGLLWTNVTTENNLIYDAAGNMSIEYAKTAPLIHFEDITPDYLKADKFLICPMNYEVNVDICQQLNALGKTVIVDLGGFGGTTSYNHFSIQSNRGKTMIDRLCQYTTIIKVSQSDLDYIIPQKNLEERMLYFIQRGAQAVVVTMGEHGAACKVGLKSICYIPAIPPSCLPTERNLIGGGDAFTAGLIASMRNLDDLPNAAIFGNAVAALIIEAAGGCEESRMPTSAMVAKKLRNHSAKVTRIIN